MLRSLEAPLSGSSSAISCNLATQRAHLMAFEISDSFDTCFQGCVFSAASAFPFPFLHFQVAFSLIICPLSRPDSLGIHCLRNQISSSRCSSWHSVTSLHQVLVIHLNNMLHIGSDWNWLFLRICHWYMQPIQWPCPCSQVYFYLC